MLVITVALLVAGIVGYLICIVSMENNNFSLASIAGGLAVAGILAAGFVGNSHGSNEDEKREAALETTYQVKVIKETDSGFIATDQITGKTIDCKVTKDDTIVVCDGSVRQAQK